MQRHIALLRGINLGPRNRIAMPALRDALGSAGFEQVRTYVQSGNVVLDSDATPEAVAAECERVITATFALQIPVVVRTREELAEVVAHDPLGEIAVNPKRYQVCFLERPLEPAALEKLRASAAPTERIVAAGRELYTWHPEGVARSKLWTRVASPSLGVTATARNWATVTTLAEMADA